MVSLFSHGRRIGEAPDEAEVRERAAELNTERRATAVVSRCAVEVDARPGSSTWMNDTMPPHDSSVLILIWWGVCYLEYSGNL